LDVIVLPSLASLVFPLKNDRIRKGEMHRASFISNMNFSLSFQPSLRHAIRGVLHGGISYKRRELKDANGMRRVGIDGVPEHHPRANKEEKAVEKTLFLGNHSCEPV